MSEMALLQTCERDVGESRRKIWINGWPGKKHGEVSFPTQVRYDIVFFIGPIIIIATLRY
ncbi:MAG: hypothetical protein CL580_04630 [Alteromonadaceae bacterium]|nr:hypothetical protein [Alteromonadaceae bacterium]